jgi:hypothetical protein
MGAKVFEHACGIKESPTALNVFTTAGKARSLISPLLYDKIILYADRILRQ